MVTVSLNCGMHLLQLGLDALELERWLDEPDRGPSEVGEHGVVQEWDGESLVASR